MSIHSLEPQQGRSAIAAILDQVDSAVSSDRDKRSFLELIDISQPRLFEELRRIYSREAYASYPKDSNAFNTNDFPVDAVARITDWPQSRIQDR